MHFNYKEIKSDEIKYFKIHGRTINDGGLYISWSNGGIELNFKGRRVEFNFGEYAGEQPVYVKAFRREMRRVLWDILMLMRQKECRKSLQNLLEKYYKIIV